jgi:hypothetical protein
MLILDLPSKHSKVLNQKTEFYKMVLRKLKIDVLYLQ